MSDLVKQKYVLAFIFDSYLRKILLIKKLRSPAGLKDRMINKLNGVGGHLESGENPLDGIKRECKEETGLKINDFNYFCLLDAKFGEVYCFYAVTDSVHNFKQLEDEELRLYDLSESSKFNCFKNFDRMYNIDWLITMALNHYQKLDTAAVLTVKENE